MAEGGKMNEEQICEYLKCLNVPVRLNEVKQPTREFIVRVFECFLRDFQIDITNPSLRTWEATKHIENSELYEDSEFLILLLISVNHLTDPCGLKITLKDIAEPKPKRTKKILNYLIVFWNYYLRKLAQFRTLQEAFKADVERAEALAVENEILDEKYGEHINILENLHPSKKEILETVSAKSSKIADLEKQKESLVAEYQVLKANESDLRNNIISTDVDIASAKEKLGELSQLIISSPERLNSDIQRMKERMKAEDLKIKDKEVELKEKKKLLHNVTESFTESEKTHVVFKEKLEECQVLCDVVKAVVLSQQTIEEEEAKLKKLHAELSSKIESKQQHEDKSIKLLINTKKQKETLKEILEIYHCDEDKEKKSLESIKSSQEQIQQIIESETNTIQEIMNTYEESVIKVNQRESEFYALKERAEDEFQTACGDIIKMVAKNFPLNED